VENNILIEKDVENFHRLKSKDLDLLLDRIGDSQFVLLGEASHGTSEFYRWRTEITKRLINEKGFSLWLCYMKIQMIDSRQKDRK